MSISLYIHIPFCRSKCYYCSFDSFAGQEALIDGYLRSLAREAASYHGVRFDTIYIGGGTPTHLNNTQLADFFEGLGASVALKTGAEFTVEVNPASCDIEKAGFLKSQGVNRVSLGVQSLEDKNLRWLGRGHTAQEARRSFDVLREAGFGNINLDLIYGLPGQRAEDVLRDVDRLLDLGSEHVSLYTLSVEKGCVLFGRPLAIPSPEDQAVLYEAVAGALVDRGMTHYEVSNFCRPGFACRHNLNTWRNGEYVGLGAAAHGHQDGVRSWNVSSPARYIEMIDQTGCAEIAKEELGPEERYMEALLIGLRLTEGVDISGLEKMFSLKMPLGKQGLIEEFRAAGLFERKGAYLKATRRGLLVLDEISGRLI